MTISKVLKKRREEIGMKVKDVALIVEVAESTYREWENGRKIQGEPYLKLAKALDMPIGNLLELDQSESLKSIIQVIDELERHIKNIRSNVIQLL